MPAGKDVILITFFPEHRRSLEAAMMADASNLPEIRCVSCTQVTKTTVKRWVGAAHLIRFVIGTVPKTRWVAGYNLHHRTTESRLDYMEDNTWSLP